MTWMKILLCSNAAMTRHSCSDNLQALFFLGCFPIRYMIMLAKLCIDDLWRYLCWSPLYMHSPSAEKASSFGLSLILRQRWGYLHRSSVYPRSKDLPLRIFMDECVLIITCSRSTRSFPIDQWPVWNTPQIFSNSLQHCWNMHSPSLGDRGPQVSGVVPFPVLWWWTCRPNLPADRRRKILGAIEATVGEDFYGGTKL